MAKCNRSSPSSFFIFRRRLNTARQGPHHCWYTSTTKAEREKYRVQSAVTPNNTRGQQHTINHDISHSISSFFSSTQFFSQSAEQKQCCSAKSWQQTALSPPTFLPVKPLVPSMSSHCSWLVTETWSRKRRKTDSSHKKLRSRRTLV